MLQRHNKLWLLFALCLLLILPAMIWLSVKAISTDRDLRRDRRETELARREAEVQEKITSALYRMDWKLGPHIAREAARPYYLYESFYSSGLPPVGATSEVPSPLLSGTSHFVKLHFQIEPGNIYSSPQRPKSEADCQRAFTCCGITAETVTERDVQLAEVQQLCDYDAIVKQIRSSVSFPNEFDQLAGNVYLQAPAYNFANKFKQQQLEVQQRRSDGNEKNAVAQVAKPNSKSEVQKLRASSRGGREFVQRQESYGANTMEWANDNRANNPQGWINPGKDRIEILEGVMRPIWIADNLFLTRLVKLSGREVVQCCWLDWQKIQQTLREEVGDILPEVDFEPVTNDEMLSPERALVTLPVQVLVDSNKLLASSVINDVKVVDAGFSGLQVALLVAWGGLIFSAFAIGFLLHGVLQLSERRASFVSAVTHELRTPLTTFKMYSEMLAERMVPEEKQVQYAQTLKLQAERLSHLVENVLQFARLERGADRQTVEATEMKILLAGIDSRLKERALQSDRNLIFQIDKHVLSKKVKVEPHAIEQILFNLVDNACKYAKHSSASDIEISGRMKNDRIVELSVRDFGPGVCGSNAQRVFQPFRKSDLEAANSEPGVGLGLSLCRRMARSFKGRIYYENCDPGAKFFLEIPVAC